MPFFNNGTQFVPRKFHAVKIGKAISALNIFTYKSEFTKIELRVVEIAEGNLKHTSLQSLTRNLCKEQLQSEINLRVWGNDLKNDRKLNIYIFA